MCIVKFLVVAIVTAICFATVVIVLWFAFALIVTFYKIYLKPKPEPEPKMDCTHDHIYCDEGHPEFPFVCSKCRKRF